MRIALNIVVFGCLFQGPAALAAPITFNTALPVSAEETMLREQLVVNKSGADTTHDTRTEVTSVTTVGYGFTPDLAVFVSAPYTSRAVDVASATRAGRGFGDAELFARYTVYQHDALGATFRIAPFAGVKAPTGDTNARDHRGKLPASVQAGSGSWDVFGGAIATYASTDYTVDGQIGYRENRRGNGSETGDIIRADASLQYRLWPETLDAGTPGFFYGVLETNLMHQGRSRVAGVVDADTGGTSFTLVPGVQYATRRWIAELALQVPVHQNLNGNALRNDYQLRTGIHVNF